MGLFKLHHHRDRRRSDAELLSAYLDGELSPAHMEAVRRRLAQEPALQRELEALSALDGLLEEAWLAPAEPLRDLTDGVMRRVRQDLARPRWWELFPTWPRLNRPAWTAAWALGGILAGLLFLNDIEQRASETLVIERSAQELIFAMTVPDDEDVPMAAVLQEGELTDGEGQP